MSEQKRFLISFKDTSSVKDIILVLNSLSMITHNVDLINKLKTNENIVLKEFSEEEASGRV